MAEPVRLGMLRSAAGAAAVLALIVGVPAAAAAPVTHTVAIEGMRFVPETLTIKRGDRVVFRNQDLVPHTATGPGGFDSKTIAAGANWHYQANKSGTFSYVCSFHPGMKGTLIVQAR